MDVNQAFKSVARATYATATGHMNDKEVLAKIKDALARASAEIDAIGKPTP
jgi:hypothetical protein